MKKHKHQWYKTKEPNNYRKGEYQEFTCGVSGCELKKRMYIGDFSCKWRYIKSKSSSLAHKENKG